MAPPDLRAVDDLCRLALAAQRLGCTVRLGGATDELRSILALAGVSELLVDLRPDTNTDTSTKGTDAR